MVSLSPKMPPLHLPVIVVLRFLCFHEISIRQGGPLYYLTLLLPLLCCSLCVSKIYKVTKGQASSRFLKDSIATINLTVAQYESSVKTQQGFLDFAFHGKNNFSKIQPDQKFWSRWELVSQYKDSLCQICGGATDTWSWNPENKGYPWSASWAGF